MGPASTQPWAEFSMKWWLAQGIPKEKLVMGIPAYSNDYSALPCMIENATVAEKIGCNGSQGAAGPPTDREPMCNGWRKGGNATEGKRCGPVEPIWNFFDQIYQCACPTATVGRR